MKARVRVSSLSRGGLVTRLLGGCFVLSFLLMAGGCGGGHESSPPPASTLGPEGGSATSADGRATVTFPAGALSAPTAVSIGPASSPPAGALAGTAYTLGPEGTRLSIPANLRIAYAPAQVPAGVAECDLRLGKLSGSSWLPMYECDTDTVGNCVTGALHGFSTYGILPPGANGGADSLTVHVVDAVPPGSNDQFLTLSEALAYLAAHLAPEHRGTVILDTDRQQQVASLGFPFDLRIRLATGRTAAIAGPGATPLIVDAAGALDLNGLTIVNPGGVVVNANRNLQLVGMHMPETEVDIGGLMNARFPAGERGYEARKGTERLADGANISGSEFGGDLKFNLQADVAASASYSLSNNSAPGASVSGAGVLRADASLNLLNNAFGYIDANLRMGGTAALVINDHTSLSQFNLSPSAEDGNPTITLNGNVTADLQVQARGIGKLTLNATANNIQNGHVDISVKDWELLGVNQVYGNMAIILGTAIANPNAAWSELQSTFDGLSVDAMNSEAGKLSFTLEKVRFNGEVAVNSKAQVKLHLTDDVTFSAAAKVKVTSNVLDLTQTRVTYSGMATFEAQGASASITIQSQGGEFKDITRIIAPPNVGLSVVITDAAFSKGGVFYVGPTEMNASELASDARGVGAHVTGSGVRPSALGPTSRRQAREDAGGIELRNLTYDRAGWDLIEIEQVDVPVTVEDSHVSVGQADYGLGLTQVSGAISVKNCTFDGGGVAVLSCSGATTITDNTFNMGPQAAVAIGVTHVGSVTATNNTINCQSSAASAIATHNTDGPVKVTGNQIDGAASDVAIAIGVGRVDIDNNPMISGKIVVGFGPLHLSGNTLAGAYIVDGNPAGGLLINPNQNDGFDPANCITMIDWDGNGCCDYPPYENERDSQGNCHCPGISPPGGLR